MNRKSKSHSELPAAEERIEKISMALEKEIHKLDEISATLPDLPQTESDSAKPSFPPERTVDEGILHHQRREKWINVFNYYKIEFEPWVDPMELDDKLVRFDFYLPYGEIYFLASDQCASEPCPDYIKEAARKGIDIVCGFDDGTYKAYHDNYFEVVEFGQKEELPYTFNFKEFEFYEKERVLGPIPKWKDIIEYRANTDPGSEQNILTNPIVSYPDNDPLIDEKRWLELKKKMTGDWDQTMADFAKHDKINQLISDYPNFRDSKEFTAFCHSIFCPIGTGKNRALYFPPILLVGPSGCGKTSFAKKFAEILTELPPNVLTMGNDPSPFQIVGSDLQHRDSRYGFVVQAMLAQTAYKTVFPLRNPVIIFDDVDKGGNALSTFASILDRENSKTFTDFYLNFPIDASGVNYILTATDISKIPISILNRVTVINIREYTHEEVEDMVNDIFDRLVKTAAKPDYAIAPYISESDRKDIAKKADYQPSKIEGVIWQQFHELLSPCLWGHQRAVSLSDSEEKSDKTFRVMMVVSFVLMICILFGCLRCSINAYDHTNPEQENAIAYQQNLVEAEETLQEK